MGRIGRKRRPQLPNQSGDLLPLFLLPFSTLPGLEREELMNNGWQRDLCGASSALFWHHCDLMRAFDPAHTKV